jgi:YVTN family beta-propeller protein
VKSLSAALVAALLLLTACGSHSKQGATSPTSPSSRAPSASTTASGDPAWVTARVTTGAQPCGILGAAGKVWVSDYGNDDLVTIDPTSLEVSRGVAVGGKPCGLAFGAGSIWVEDYGSNEVTRVDAHTGGVQKTYPVGLSPYDVTFAAGAAWVTNYNDGTVSRIDAATGRVTHLRVGGTPIGIAPGGGSVWVGTGTGGIVGIDTRTARVTQRIRTDGSAGWTAYDGRRVWVNVGSTVAELDPVAGRIVRRSTVGTTPADGSVIDGVVWVPDQDGDIYRIDHGGVERPVTSGVGNPFVLAGYRGDAWAVDFVGTDVVRIDPSRLR